MRNQYNFRSNLDAENFTAVGIPIYYKSMVSYRDW